MTKKVSILFDLDGTLLNTSTGIFSCLKYACEKMNLTYPPESELHKFIGPPIKHSFMNILGLNNEDADKGVALFRQEYKDSGIRLSVPYEGMAELLSELKSEGYKLGVSTLKPQLLSEEILAYHNIAQYFDVIVGADLDAKFTKAHIIKLAMEQLNVLPENTVMVGDTASDAIGAESAKVDFLPVSYGFGLKNNEVEQYPHVKMANSVSEIKDILKSI